MAAGRGGTGDALVGKKGGRGRLLKKKQCNVSALATVAKKTERTNGGRRAAGSGGGARTAAGGKLALPVTAAGGSGGKELRTVTNWHHS